MITVVGLGVEYNDVTLNGVQAIKSATKLIIKTNLTPTYNYFKDYSTNIESLDRFYVECQDFNKLDDAIVGYLCSIDQSENIVYMVNGSGVDDRSVKLLLELVPDTKIIVGVARESALLINASNISYEILTACDIVDMPVFAPNKSIALVVKDIFNNYIAGEIKLNLTKIFGDEAMITFHSAGQLIEIPLFELDRQANYDYTTAIVILPVELTKRKAFVMSDLMEILYRLRGENGCPWDIEQTHKSITTNLVEEAYELVDAISKEDVSEMIEETGDVLLQAVFHAVIGEQTGEYDIYDTYKVLCDKLITRHTHIFGDNIANTGEVALGFWEAAKAKEKNYLSIDDRINKVAVSLPTLLYVSKLQKIVKKDNTEQDIDKLIRIVASQIQALCEAVKNKSEYDTTKAGVLLFNLVNIMRKLDIKANIELRNVATKYIELIKNKVVDNNILVDEQVL